MNGLILQESQFNEDHKLITLVWNGKPCWIAKQIAELSSQADSRNSVSAFLKR